MGVRKKLVLLETAALAVALAVLAVPAASPAAPENAKPSFDRKLDRDLDRIIRARKGPPGLSVLIRGSAGRDFRERGAANLRNDRIPDIDDHMRLASVAKSYSGAVALALVERGLLSLDDTIGERLPGLMPRADRVTLAQALQHTGGLPDYIKNQAFIDLFIADPARYFEPRELIGFVRDDPLEFEPGSQYRYSDTDNIIVGLMAEAASGRSYDELLAAYIYDPLGLTDTSLPITVRMPRPYLHGYELEPGEKPQDVSELINASGAWASGGLVSTPREVGRFFRAYIGARLFSDATRRLQRTFVSGSSDPAGPGTNDAGLGVFRYRTGCGTMLGAAGSFPGYRQFAAASRDGRRSVVFTVNAQILPGSGSDRVSNLIRRAQRLAVCQALRG